MVLNLGIRIFVRAGSYGVEYGHWFTKVDWEET